MKIIYTDSALSELERFQQLRKEELESLLKNKKYVFGDEVIEITASDIREVEKSFNVIDSSKTRLPITNLLLKTYLVAGIVMVVIGLFYQDILQMIDQNPTQLALVLGGGTLSLVSLIGSYYVRIRQDRRDEIERRYIEHELISRKDDKSDS